MNFGLYPGVGSGGGNQSEGWPIIGQAIEMGYSVNSFTANGQEYLKGGIAKPYTPKYSTFFNRNPYACSQLTAYTDHKTISLSGGGNFTYISLANGYHYVIPVEGDSSTYDGALFTYSTTLSSGFSTSTLYPTTSLARANVAVAYNNYVAIGLQSSTDTVSVAMVSNASLASSITGFSNIYGLATNGSTSILGIRTTNSNLTNGGTNQLVKFTSTAGGYPSTGTAVTSAVGVSHTFYRDNLACIPTGSLYLSIGYTSSGSGFNVLSIIKSTDLGTNWSLLHSGTIPVVNTLATYRSARNFATNGTSAIINIYGEPYYASTLVWTDGTTVQNIDLSSILPGTYSLSNATVNYDSVKDLYYIHFFQYGSTKSGVFTAYSKDGKIWYPKFNIYPSRASAMVEVMTKRGYTIAMTNTAINSNTLNGFIDISAYINKSIPSYINTTNPQSGNSLSTFYRVA